MDGTGGPDVVDVVAQPDVSALPWAPKNPLPYLHQLKAKRSFIDGLQKLADAGGPVSRIVLGPTWLFPTAVVITRDTFHRRRGHSHPCPRPYADLKHR